MKISNYSQKNAVIGGLLLAAFFTYIKIPLISTITQNWATMQHECFHALAAYATGGRVNGIEFPSEGGGLAITTGGWYPFISLAGYMGTVAYAAFLAISSTKNKGIYFFVVSQAIISFTLLINAYLSLLAWALVAFSAVSIVIVAKFQSKLLVSFLSSLLFFESLSDVSVLASSAISKTDAGLLANSLGMQILMYPIALLHICFVFYCIYFSVKRLIGAK